MAGTSCVATHVHWASELWSPLGVSSLTHCNPERATHEFFWVTEGAEPSQLATHPALGNP